MTLRALPILVGLTVTASPAQAVDYRWSYEFAQGTDQAIIQNGEGAAINISCPSGQTDTTPSVFLTSRKVNLRGKRLVDVQFVVDGRNYAFTFDGDHMLAGTRIGKGQLNSLVQALISSRARSFQVEFPKDGKAERFSLLNARDALRSGNQSILQGCI